MRLLVPPFRCLSCGMEALFVSVPDSEGVGEGDELSCDSCLAVHRVVGDGLQLTGERDEE